MLASRLSLAALVFLFISGCAQPTPPPAETPTNGLTKFPLSEFVVPQGDSFGWLLPDLAPGDARGPSKTFSVLANLSAFDSNSFVRMLSFVEVDGAWTLSSAAGSFGTGTLGVGGGDGTDRPTLAVLLIFHAPSGGLVRIAVEGQEEPAFEGAAEPATWNMTGAAIVSFYQEGNTDVAYEVESQRVGDPSSAVTGGALILSTSHEAPVGSLEISTLAVYGTSFVGAYDVSWNDGGQTVQKQFPVAGAVVPASTGYRLVDRAAGATQLSVRAGDAAPSGGVAFEHFSVPFGEEFVFAEEFAGRLPV